MASSRSDRFESKVFLAGTSAALPFLLSVGRAVETLKARYGGLIGNRNIRAFVLGQKAVDSEVRTGRRKLKARRQCCSISTVVA